MNGPFEKPPHLVRATVVATLSDGSRVSWVIAGDEDTAVSIETELKNRKVGLRTYETRTDLTFKLTEVPSYIQYNPQGAGDGQAEIPPAPPAIGPT